jgi:enoyl-CoA hydratase/carnithine racemase
MANKIELSIKESIAIIRFIDPENYNPLNMESAKEMLEALDSLRNRDDIRSIIITGSGNAFSAGGDVKRFKESIEQGTPGQFMDMLTLNLYKMAKILRLYPKPVVAAVNGWAVGAGMNLALSCDLVIASEKAMFRQSFCKLALIPGFAGSILLSRQLTWQQATQMAFFGDSYSAKVMQELGFINEITPPEKLDEVALKWAKRLASGPTLMYKRTKELFFKALSSPMEEHLEYERQMQIKSAQTEDYKIGVNALIEKNEPTFIGK